MTKVRRVLRSGTRFIHQMNVTSTRDSISCQRCTSAKRQCDKQRPCGRCVRLGAGDGCVDYIPSPRKKRKPGEAIRAACVGCREAKLKCSEGQSCKRCVSKGMVCIRDTFPNHPGRPMHYDVMPHPPLDAVPVVINQVLPTFEREYNSSLGLPHYDSSGTLKHEPVEEFSPFSLADVIMGHHGLFLSIISLLSNILSSSLVTVASRIIEGTALCWYGAKALVIAKNRVTNFVQNTPEPTPVPCTSPEELQRLKHYYLHEHQFESLAGMGKQGVAFIEMKRPSSFGEHWKLIRHHNDALPEMMGFNSKQVELVKNSGSSEGSFMPLFRLEEFKGMISTSNRLVILRALGKAFFACGEEVTGEVEFNLHGNQVPMKFAFKLIVGRDSYIDAFVHAFTPIAREYQLL